MSIYYTSSGVRVNTSYSQTFQNKSGTIALTSDVSAVESQITELENNIESIVTSVIQGDNYPLFSSRMQMSGTVPDLEVHGVCFLTAYRLNTCQFTLPASGRYLMWGVCCDSAWSNSFWVINGTGVSGGTSWSNHFTFDASGMVMVYRQS